MNTDRLKFLGQQAVALRIALENKTAEEGAAKAYRDIMRSIDTEVAMLKQQYPTMAADEDSPEYRALRAGWLERKRQQGKNT